MFDDLVGAFSYCLQGCLLLISLECLFAPSFSYSALPLCYLWHVLFYFCFPCWILSLFVLLLNLKFNFTWPELEELCHLTWPELGELCHLTWPELGELCHLTWPELGELCHLICLELVELSHLTWPELGELCHLLFLFFPYFGTVWRKWVLSSLSLHPKFLDDIHLRRHCLSWLWHNKTKVLSIVSPIFWLSVSKNILRYYHSLSQLLALQTILSKVLCYPKIDLYRTFAHCLVLVTVLVRHGVQGSPQLFSAFNGSSQHKNPTFTPQILINQPKSLIHTDNCDTWQIKRSIFDLLHHRGGARSRPPKSVGVEWRWAREMKFLWCWLGAMLVQRCGDGVEY